MAKKIKHQLSQAYTKAHWGTNPAKVIKLPKHFPDSWEMGKLSELRIAPLNEPDPGPVQEKDAFAIEIEPDKINLHRLLVEHDHPHDRLWIKMTPESRKEAKSAFWNSSDSYPIPLSLVAFWAGGHHGSDDYPAIKVKPIGRVSHLMYITIKKADGLSNYVHEMGEEWKGKTGVRPILAVDSTGQLWLAGGSYSVIAAGIIR